MVQENEAQWLICFNPAFHRATRLTVFHRDWCIQSVDEKQQTNCRRILNQSLSNIKKDKVRRYINQSTTNTITRITTWRNERRQSHLFYI